ncbi:MAG: hypothetical protein WC408_05870 [Candidatus Micrarchaeia archaeon]|jgi:hypothetical protein
MAGDLKKSYYDATRLRNAILENKNIDILLYLAKYNPNVSRQDIVNKFGKASLKGLELLKDFHLVKEDSGLSLTSEGIFQVDGLLTMVV